MIKIKNVSTILFIIILIVVFLGSFSFAQGKDLEVNYPEVFGEALNSNTTLEDYVKYIFNLALMISGFVVFGVLVYAGFRYLTSAESPTARADAKSRIIAAFLGLIIILCSWLILYTLNPQLTIIKPSIETLCNCSLPKDQWGTSTCLNYCEQATNAFRGPGVYLVNGSYKDGDKCITDVGSGNCIRFVGSAAKLENGFNDSAKKIRITNMASSKYWGILHEDSNYKGQCRFFSEKAGQDFQDVPGSDEWGKIDKPSAITVFQEAVKTDGSYIELCRQINFKDCVSYDKSNTKLNLEDITLTGGGTVNMDSAVLSVKIEGNYLVALFENKLNDNFTGKCQVFTESIADLSKEPIGQCGLGCVVPSPLGGCLFSFWQKSCASSIAIFSIIK